MDPEQYQPQQYQPQQNPLPNDQGAGRRPRNEKEEKDQEKQQEKGQGLDEKYRRDPLGFVAFAILIIWLGVFLLLQNQELISYRGPRDSGNDKEWAIFAWGAAAIWFVEILLRLGVPRWRRPLSGSFVWCVIAAAIGAGLWTQNWEIIGPIAIIAVGVGILVGRLVPRR